MPSLNVQRTEVDFAVDTIESVLGEVVKKTLVEAADFVQLDFFFKSMNYATGRVQEGSRIR